MAEETIADVDASGMWPGKVVTEVSEAGPFWEAEPEHQDYLQRYPNGYTCHFPRPDWKLPHRQTAANEIGMGDSEENVDGAGDLRQLDRGDYDAVFALLDTDIEWFGPPDISASGSLSGLARGHDGVRRSLADGSVNGTTTASSCAS